MRAERHTPASRALDPGSPHAASARLLPPQLRVVLRAPCGSVLPPAPPSCPGMAPGETEAHTPSRPRPVPAAQVTTPPHFHPEIVHRASPLHSQTLACASACLPALAQPPCLDPDLSPASAAPQPGRGMPFLLSILPEPSPPWPPGTCRRPGLHLRLLRAPHNLHWLPTSPLLLLPSLE